MRIFRFISLVTCLATVALADDFKTIHGKEYKNVTVSRVEADGIVLKTKSGISKVYFTELPKEVQKRFNYDPEKAASQQRALGDKRIEAQKAAERERAEKEKNAVADSKRAVEQFQAAEDRASQKYQSATKGTLSGQVFVSTGGGENFRLGAVQVMLFARDAIDTLLTGIKKYADYKIQELSGPVAQAKAAMDRAEESETAARDAVSQADLAISKAILAGGDWRPEERIRDVAREAVNSTREATSAARRQYSELDDKLSVYYSGAFYFQFLQSPIQTAETDADGKFAIEVPKTGAFVIAAKAEHYYWLQPVSLEGRPQRIQNLSNSNLTRTTGTFSLILTRD